MSNYIYLEDLCNSGDEKWTFFKDVLEATPLTPMEDDEVPGLDPELFKSVIKNHQESSLSKLTDYEKLQMFPPDGVPTKKNLSKGKDISAYIDGADNNRQEILGAAAYWAGVARLVDHRKRTWGKNLSFQQYIDCPHCQNKILVEFRRGSRRTTTKACPECNHRWSGFCDCKSCSRKNSLIQEHIRTYINCAHEMTILVDEKYSNESIGMRQKKAEVMSGKLGMSDEDMYLAVVKNKFKLSANERNFIKCYKDIVMFHEDEHESIIKIVGAISNGTSGDYRILNELLGHGIIVLKTTYNAKSSVALIDELLLSLFDSYRVHYKTIGGGWGYTSLQRHVDEDSCRGLLSPNTYIECIGHAKAESIRACLFSVKETYCVNPYFLSPKPEDLKSETGRDTGTRSIFGSLHEKNQFMDIVAEHPGKIVLPNYPISVFVDFSNKKLKSSFSEEDLGYLKRARVDYLVANMSGEPESVIELQIGRHHYKKQYKERDNLKIKLFEICGIPMIEEFGRAHANYFKDESAEQDLFDASHQVEEYGDF